MTPSWTAYVRTLVALRRAWPDRPNADRQAALGCYADADGMLHYGPFTVDDARMWASFLLMGPDELEALA